MTVARWPSVEVEWLCLLLPWRGGL